jgi:hypothetical protein
MATTKTAAKNKSIVDVAKIDEQFGQYAVADYDDSIYARLYHGIRQVLGLKAQYAIKQKGQAFSWQDFNKTFTEVMGDPKAESKDRKYSLEQLIEYGRCKTGHSVEELLEINRKSFERRKKWQEQNNPDYNEVDDEF